MSRLAGKRSVRLRASQPEVMAVDGNSRLDPRLVEGWRELVEATADSLVTMHPRIVLGNQPPEASRTPGMMLYSSDEDGKMANLAVLSKRTVALPALRGLPWRPSLPGLCLVGSRVLGSAAAIPAFAARLEDLLHGPSSGYACLLLEDVPIDSPWWHAFEQSPLTRAVTLVAPQTQWFLRFHESADEYWSRFSSKTRNNFRRKRRAFEHQWEAVEDASQVAAFLVEASAVSARSWQGRRLGLRIRSDDSQLRQFCALAELGALRCYLLRSRGEPVAFVMGTQWHGRFVLEELGYDTRYADHSPGSVLLLDMLEDMFQRHTPELLDFGFGDAPYKQLFGNESIKSGVMLVVARRVGPTLALGMSRMGARLERIARAGVRWSGLEGWLRKAYRR